MIKKLWLLTAVILAVGLLPHAGWTRSSNTLSKADRTFITEAAQGGIAEVSLGKLAMKRAKSAQVRSFASRMVTDHSTINNDLKRVASHKNIKLPAMMAAKQMAELIKLEALRGDTFDRNYMQLMVADHEGDLHVFRHEAKTAQDADLKAFVQRNLPTIEQHFKMAENTKTIH